MTPGWRLTRRRLFVSTAGGLAALAGCTDDEDGSEENGDEGENDEVGEPSADESSGYDGDDEDYGEGGGENGEQGSQAGEETLDVEGTNLFVRVVDGERIAIEGATVTITGGAFDGEAFETDADGRVIQRNVEPGEYTVTASVGGEEHQERAALETGHDESLWFTFSSSAGEEERNDGEGESEAGIESGSAGKTD